MPPRIPRKTGSGFTSTLAVEEAVRVYFEREAQLVSRACEPTLVVNSTYHAKPSQFVLCNSSAGAFNVYLPALNRAVLGQQVMVVVWGDSTGATLTNSVTVHPSDASAVIAASTKLVISTVNLVHQFIAATTSKWMVK